MFSEAERQIFGPYFNGHELVYADPQVVLRQLYAKLDGDPNRFIEEANSDDPSKRNAALDRLIPASREALDLAEFNTLTGHGAIEVDVLSALRLFLDFIQKKSPRVESLPTSYPRSDPISWREGPLTIQDTSPSGSTEKECGCNKPGSISGGSSWLWEQDRSQANTSTP
jgi:hypothetical protein